MKIYLRPIRLDDSLTSFKWRNNPKIWKLTANKPDKIITPGIELEHYTKVLSNKDEARYAICLEESNNYIGNVQLTNIINSSAEFHLFIGEEKYWAKGIGTAATKEMIHIGFNSLKLKEIYLFVNNRNIAAIKAYLNSGFLIKECNKNKIKMVIHNIV